MISEERQTILNQYAATSRAFSDTVERLRQSGANDEAFIRALAETGSTRRACERMRIKLDKHLAGCILRDHSRSVMERDDSRGSHKVDE